MSKYLIGLDIGTSAIKGVLTNHHGDVLATAEKGVRFLTSREGWIEVDPEQHYTNVCGVIRKLAQAARDKVIGLAIAAASGNTLLTDTHGSPLRPIVNWMDQRAVNAPPPFLDELDATRVARIVGWPCVHTFPLAHLAWLRENEKPLYRSAAHYGMDTDWLLYRLTGKWTMDHSTATTFHLQDQEAHAYYRPFLERLNIAPEKLSPLTTSGVAVGRLTPHAARDTGLTEETVAVTGCFDHPAAARATGVLSPGQFMLSCGTSWVGFIPHTSRQDILNARMLCDPFLSSTRGIWAGMFSIPRIGLAIDWYLQHAIAPGEPNATRIFDESAAAAEPGAGGLEIDLRAHPRPIKASRNHISRAVMEGAARLLNEHIHALAAHGFHYRQAVMVGGPTQSPIWPGIVEEITGLRIHTGGRSAGARGAAILAGIGTGVYRDEHAALAAGKANA